MSVNHEISPSPLSAALSGCAHIDKVRRTLPLIAVKVPGNVDVPVTTLDRLRRLTKRSGAAHRIDRRSVKRQHPRGPGDHHLVERPVRLDRQLQRRHQLTIVYIRPNLAIEVCQESIPPKAVNLAVNLRNVGCERMRSGTQLTLVAYPHVRRASERRSKQRSVWP